MRSISRRGKRSSSLNLNFDHYERSGRLTTPAANHENYNWPSREEKVRETRDTLGKSVRNHRPHVRQGAKYSIKLPREQEDFLNDDRRLGRNSFSAAKSESVMVDDRRHGDSAGRMQPVCSSPWRSKCCTRRARLASSGGSHAPLPRNFDLRPLRCYLTKFEKSSSPSPVHGNDPRDWG